MAIFVLAYEKMKNKHMHYVKQLIALLAIFSSVLAFGQENETNSENSISSYNGLERVWVENGEVSIVPPDEFERSIKFHGFLHRNTATTISIVKIPSYAKSLFETGLTQEYFDQYGLTYISEEKIELDSLKGTLYKFDFTASNVEMRRLTLLTGDYRNSYIILGNFPRIVAEDMEHIIKECLLTTTIHK